MVQIVPVAMTFFMVDFFCSGDIIPHLFFIVPKLVNGALYKFPQLTLVSPPVVILSPNKLVVVLLGVVSNTGGSFSFGLSYP